MSEKSIQNLTKFRVTKLHKEFAELLVDTDLTMDEIAKRLHRSRGRLYQWLEIPAVQNLIKEREERNVQKARFIYSRYLPHAAQCVILILDTMNREDPNRLGETRPELVHSPETVLKAARYMAEICKLIDPDKKEEKEDARPEHPLDQLFRSIGELDAKSLLMFMGHLQKRIHPEDTATPPSRFKLPS